MVPSKNTIDLAGRLLNSKLNPLYPDAGHGGIFQYHEEFVKRAVQFLCGGDVASWPPRSPCPRRPLGAWRGPHDDLTDTGGLAPRRGGP